MRGGIGCAPARVVPVGFAGVNAALVSAWVERCCSVMRPSVASDWAGKFNGSVPVRGGFAREVVAVAAAVLALVARVSVTDEMSLRSCAIVTGMKVKEN